MLRKRRRIDAAAVGIAVFLAASRWTGATENDLYVGLTHLRAGEQSQALQYLTRYRDGEQDPEIRRDVALILPLLKQPLAEDVREYLALTLEQRVQRHSQARIESRRPAYRFRIFPVFP